MCDDHIVLTCVLIFQLQAYPVHHLVTKHAYCMNMKLIATCMYLLPVPLLGTEYVGRVEEARGEENTSLWRPAAGEQIGLIIVNPLTTLHAFKSNCAQSLNMLGYREERWTGSNYGETSATP